MAEVRKITCDNCETDLTYTGNCYDYRLVLASQSIGREYTGEAVAVTAMHVPDPMPQAAHFCGMRCLDEWLTGGQRARRHRG